MRSELTIRMRGKDLQVVVEEGGSVVVDGERHQVEILKSSENLLTLSIDGRVITAASREPASENDESPPSERMILSTGGMDLELEIDDERSRLLKTFRPSKGAGGGTTRIKAPMPGLVVRLEVEKGQQVKPGQGLLVLEAMKMENEIRSQVSGLIAQIDVKPGSTVEKDAILMTIRAPEST
jgi:biotin carboxyl carrier protein